MASSPCGCGLRPHRHMAAFFGAGCRSASHLVHTVVSAISLVVFVAIAMLLNMAEVRACM